MNLSSIRNTSQKKEDKKHFVYLPECTQQTTYFDDFHTLTWDTEVNTIKTSEKNKKRFENTTSLNFGKNKKLD